MATLLYQDPRRDSTFLYQMIIKHLDDPQLVAFRAVVGYATWSGLSLIADRLEAFLSKGGRVDTVFGVNNGVTTPDALLYAWHLKAQFPAYGMALVSNWVYSNSVFHPKYFEFHFDRYVVAVVGSANLTGGGLAYNHEACLQIRTDRSDDVVQQLQVSWDSICQDSSAVTVSGIRKLLTQAKLAKEMERDGRPQEEGRRRRKHKRLPRSRKPLFAYILGQDLPTAAKHRALANADVVSDRPRHLYLELMEETGRGYQIQLPKATLGVFFGIGGEESKQVTFRFEDEEETLCRQLSQFSNDTARVRLLPLRTVRRPAVVVFTHIGYDSYRCKVVSQRDFARVVRTKCTQQTRKGSRRWGFGD